MSDLADQIETDAAKPQSTSVDGVNVEQRPLPDLIAADKHLRAQEAMDDTSGGWPLKTFKISPPGGR